MQFSPIALCNIHLIGIWTWASLEPLSCVTGVMLKVVSIMPVLRSSRSEGRYRPWRDHYTGMSGMMMGGSLARLVSD